MPEMSSLSPSDRVTLVASNSRAVAGLMWVWFLGNRGAYLHHLREHGRKRREVKGGDGEVSDYETVKLLDLLESALSNPAAAGALADPQRRCCADWPISASYDVGDRGAELEDMRSEITRGFHMTASSSSSSSSSSTSEVVADPSLIMLMSAAMFFSPDSVDEGVMALEDEEKVRNIWRRHMMALEKYLRCVLGTVMCSDCHKSIYNILVTQ